MDSSNLRCKNCVAYRVMESIPEGYGACAYLCKRKYVGTYSDKISGWRFGCIVHRDFGCRFFEDRRDKERSEPFDGTLNNENIRQTLSRYAEMLNTDVDVAPPIPSFTTSATTTTRRRNEPF